MKSDIAYYAVSPKIVKADEVTEVEIIPLFGHCSFDEEREYAVSLVPMDSFTHKAVFSGDQVIKLRPQNGVMRVSFLFEGEQEHLIRIEGVCDISVYSLADDLWSRRPFKGDLHIHSSYSDGKESPAYVAGSCRKIGMDFMAVTDHGKYFPSIEAQETYKNVELDMKIFRGEEVHPPDNPVHIINFGGKSSVNELFKDEETYRRGVQSIQEGLGEVPNGVDRYQYASTQWCFEQIKERDGLGIFCHPFWVVPSGYSPSTMLTAFVFEQQPFDAYEVIGGYYRNELDSNTLQVAWYHEQRARGRIVPIVGVSDAHGCETGSLFGWYYTIVFAPKLEFDDLIHSIKGLYSVAVEAVPGGPPRAFGPFRLVKYALFLMREVFPRHDELCVEEGRLMLDYAAGRTDAAAELARLKGRCTRLLDTYWG